MDKEQLLMAVLAIVLAVSVLQAFQLSGLVKNVQAAALKADAAKLAASPASGQAGLAVPAVGQQQTRPSASPAAGAGMVGGC